jgi:hypothetical protein
LSIILVCCLAAAAAGRHRPPYSSWARTSASALERAGRLADRSPLVERNGGGAQKDARLHLESGRGQQRVLQTTPTPTTTNKRLHRGDPNRREQRRINAAASQRRRRRELARLSRPFPSARSENRTLQAASCCCRCWFAPPEAQFIGIIFATDLAAAEFSARRSLYHTRTVAAATSTRPPAHLGTHLCVPFEARVFVRANRLTQCRARRALFGARFVSLPD